MGKSSSMWGKTTGKVGGLVYATSGGEQIVREYNPNVANPNTTQQVNQRAKMKLMSQLSTALAPVIAMTKTGLVSKRNKFTKINFRYAYASGGTAQVSYENLQLTEGNAALPQIVYSGNSGSRILALAESAEASVSRVVYIIYKKTQEAKLQYVNSYIVEEPGQDGKFTLALADLVEDNYIFYAYGMKDMNAKASAQYGELQVTTANDLAKLVANRQISTTDYQFTQTRGATSNDGTPIDPVPEGKARVYVTASGPGTVSGGGVWDIGQELTVHAYPNSAQVRFVGWKINGSSSYVSRNADYTFEVVGTTDLIADFVNQEI